MRTRSEKLTVVVLSLLTVAALPGCGANAGPRQASRTPQQREALIKPGNKLGGAADVRRGFFDFWNEQIIRENVTVSTVFMGDSITELYDLHAYFVPANGVIENRGISGDLASVMVKRFEADVIQLRPRNVVILAGTNDVSNFINAKKSDEEVVNETFAPVEAMMKAARAAGINTFVCSILPTNSNFHMHAVRAKLPEAINAKLQAACAAHGCIYVDYAAQMSDANGDLRKDLARDGLHPHWAGYEIMARTLKEAAARHGLSL